MSQKSLRLKARSASSPGRSVQSASPPNAASIPSGLQHEALHVLPGASMRPRSRSEDEEERARSTGLAKVSVSIALRATSWKAIATESTTVRRRRPS